MEFEHGKTSIFTTILGEYVCVLDFLSKHLKQIQEMTWEKYFETKQEFWYNTPLEFNKSLRKMMRARLFFFWDTAYF